MESLCLVMPAYNEEAAIGEVLSDWYPLVDAAARRERRDDPDREPVSRLIVVDDGSRDGTAEIVGTFARTHPLIQLITKENGGHGAAIRYGYRLAVGTGADWIFQTDSDGQTLASEFGRLWKARRRADMVIGWRRHRQDGTGRRAVSAILRLVVALTFGVRLTDPNAPYRLMRAETLRELMPLVPDDCDLTNVVLAALCKKRGGRVLYREITFRPRRGGVNSINFKRIIKIGLKAIGDFRSLAGRA